MAKQISASLTCNTTLDQGTKDTLHPPNAEQTTAAIRASAGHDEPPASERAAQAGPRLEAEEEGADFHRAELDLGSSA